MPKKIYIAIFAILFLIAIMGAELMFGKNSIPQQKQLEREIANYQAQVDSLNAVIENHKMVIERLQNDSLYKEGILRTRYGMSQKDEKVFQMVK